MKIVPFLFGGIKILLYLYSNIKNPNTMYKLLSDLDFGRNEITGEYDVPVVEWEFDRGGRMWERFDSEEDRDLAIKANEAYNAKPHISEIIQADMNAEAITMANFAIDEFFGYAAEVGIKVAFMDVLNYAGYSARNNKIVQQMVSKIVCEYNKGIMKAQRIPNVATNVLGDFV